MVRRTRAALDGLQVHPRTSRDSSPPGSASAAAPSRCVRAARYGLPLMIAVIGGESARFAPLVDLYHQALDRFGAPAPVGVHSPGHVADTDDLARDQLWPHMKRMRDRIGAERGWGPMGPPSTTSRRARTARSTWVAGDRGDQDRRHGPCPPAGPLRPEVQRRAAPHPLLDCIGLYGTRSCRGAGTPGRGLTPERGTGANRWSRDGRTARCHCRGQVTGPRRRCVGNTDRRGRRHMDSNTQDALADTIGGQVEVDARRRFWLTHMRSGFTIFLLEALVVLCYLRLTPTGPTGPCSGGS